MSILHEERKCSVRHRACRGIKSVQQVGDEEVQGVDEVDMTTARIQTARFGQQRGRRESSVCTHIAPM